MPTGGSYSRQNRRRNTGFTLIEVMISAFVFASMIIVFSGIMFTSVRAGHMNGQYAQATSMCQHKVDEMRAVGFGRLNYTELLDAGIIDTSPSSNPFSFTQIDQVRDYLPGATTAIRVDPVNASVAQVTVSLSWKNVIYQNKISSMSITALITNVE